jgi:IS30 family transposase
MIAPNNPFTKSVGRGHDISAEESAYMRELANKGMTGTEIARLLGRGQSTVSKHLNLQGSAAILSPSAKAKVKYRVKKVLTDDTKAKPNRQLPRYLRVPETSNSYQILLESQIDDETLLDTLERLLTLHTSEPAPKPGFFSRLFGVN